MRTTTDMVFVDNQNDFESTVSRYLPVLFWSAFRRLRNIEDAEDAVQDALLSAYKCIGQFQGRSKLSTWLTTIVTNAARMKLRRHPRCEMLSLSQDDKNGGTTFASKLIAAGPTPEDVCAQTELGEVLRRALAQLSPNQQIAIQLCNLDDFSIREAANALGITKASMKSRVLRARKNLNLILVEIITTRHATGLATGGIRKGTARRRRRSPIHLGVSNTHTGPASRYVA